MYPVLSLAQNIFTNELSLQPLPNDHVVFLLLHGVPHSPCSPDGRLAAVGDVCHIVGSARSPQIIHLSLGPSRALSTF